MRWDDLREYWSWDAALGVWVDINRERREAWQAEQKRAAEKYQNAMAASAKRRRLVTESVTAAWAGLAREFYRRQTDVSPECIALVGDVFCQLSLYNPRLAAAIALHRGLWGGPALTLEHTGAHLGVSKERVRMMEVQGMEGMRRIATKLYRHLGKHSLPAPERLAQVGDAVGACEARLAQLEDLVASAEKTLADVRRKLRVG